tara:strand:- start:1960 stop:2334 length:375 start_codon:yes stop_codon:yes gene_type:complete
MTLKKRIDQILFDKEISLKEFLEDIGMSKGTYYKIKSGKKEGLNSTHLNAIIEKYGYSMNWLIGNEVNDPKDDYSKGFDIFKCENLGILLNNNHDKLMKTNETYRLFIEKTANVEAMKILKDKI